MTKGAKLFGSIIGLVLIYRVVLTSLPFEFVRDYDGKTSDARVVIVLFVSIFGICVALHLVEQRDAQKMRRHKSGTDI